MPKPSPLVGPKPKWRREGLPQLEVEMMVLFILSQPGSEKMLGSRCGMPRGGELELFAEAEGCTEPSLSSASLRPLRDGLLTPEVESAGEE